MSSLYGDCQKAYDEGSTPSTEYSLEKDFPALEIEGLAHARKRWDILSENFFSGADGTKPMRRKRPK
jgi:hypothetical protein